VTALTATPSAPAAALAAAPAGPRGECPAWRRWRAPLTVIAVILAGGLIVALLQPAAGTTGYLDPGNPQPNGARALATLLTERGTTVVRAATVAAAASAAAPAGSGAGSSGGGGSGAGGSETGGSETGGGPATLLITDPDLLTTGQLRSLARIPGDRVITEPDPAVLAVLAPGVTDLRPAPVQSLPPRCPLPGAQLAGSADLGGSALHLTALHLTAGRSTAAGAVQCYAANGHPSLVRYQDGNRTITVLGTGAPLANSGLAHLGNAALDLNLLGARSRLVWLVPGPPAPGSGGATGPEPFTSIVPFGAYLVLIQLAIAAVLAAVWRGRRLGPVVAERLPVVVRAAETVEGHGQLYRSRRARDRAAAALREAARGRILPLLGLPGSAEDTAVAAMLAARTGRSTSEMTALLAGPVPADDAALVALADGLDALEREVRSP
jgi:hypothetical protein